MTIENQKGSNVQDTEALLLETLLSGLDAREAARQAGSTLLVYLADMLVQRAREELDALKTASLSERPRAIG